MHHMITKLYIKKHTDLSVPILFPSKIQSQHDMYLLCLLLSWCRSQSMSTPKTMSQTTHPSWFPTWTTWGQTSWCRPSWSRRKLCCWSESREPPRLLWLKWDKKHWEGNVFQNVLSLTHYITHVVTPGSWWSPLDKCMKTNLLLRQQLSAALKKDKLNQSLKTYTVSV